MNAQARETTEAQAIIQEMRRLGMQVQADPDAGKVRFGPSEAMPWELRLRLREHKPAMLALLTREASEIAWRVAAIRSQVPAKGPIPFLVARQTADTGVGRCWSCGDALDAGRTVRCVLCVLAVEAVLNEVREGA
jgi:hypothetical protein